MLPKRQIVLLVIMGILVILVAAKPSYFNTLTRAYNYISRVPKIILMISTLMAIFGFTKPHDQLLPSLLGFTKPPDQLPAIEPVEPASTREARRVPQSVKKIVAARQQWKCGQCSQLLDETYEVDHIIPLYKGGSNHPSNLMALDPICHRKKTIRDSLKGSQIL
jgi:hypothetical protein